MAVFGLFKPTRLRQYPVLMLGVFIESLDYLQMLGQAFFS